MVNPTERDREIARKLIADAQDACGLYHVGLIGAITSALADARSEGAAEMRERCAQVVQDFEILLDGHKRALVRKFRSLK